MLCFLVPFGFGLREFLLVISWWLYGDGNRKHMSGPAGQIREVFFECDVFPPTAKGVEVRRRIGMVRRIGTYSSPTKRVGNV